MLRLSPAVRIFFCTQPTDMRRSFDGLAMLTEQVIGQDPFSGFLFMFRSRGGDRIKLLVWDGDGFSLFYKRLEEGTFAFPRRGVLAEGEQPPPSLELSSTELAMILGGVDPQSVKPRKRYRRPAPTRS